MEQVGVSSGEFDIVSPADRFFAAIIKDMTKEFEILTMDNDNYEVKFRMEGILIPRSYETALTAIKVTPLEDEAKGSHLTWQFAFERVRRDIVNPHFIIDLFLSYLIERDGNLDP